MFNKSEFAKIIKKIKETYNSQEEFSQKSEIGRTYLSQYMNMKLDKPPKPEILEKLAVSSHGETTYAELMEVCGYLKSINRKELKEEEYRKNESEILSYNFSTTELEILKRYLLSDSSDLEYKKFFNEFEEMLYSLDENKQNFLLKFCPKFLLNVGQNLSSIADETQSIFDKSHDILDKSLTDYLPSPQYFMIPVYGRISAGQPNWAEECIEGRLPIDPVLFNIINPEEHFFLRVNGESMNKVIRNGAYALIHKQDIVENGEIAVVLVNGDEATLKKFSKQGELIVLEPMSNDNSFQVQVYDKTTPIKVLGKYVGKFEMNK